MAELEKIRGGVYVPPLAEDINTLGRYPYTMACLLAHTAIDGAVETSDLREKMQELVQGEPIERPLDTRTLNGSRTVLHMLGLLEITETDPELVTVTTDASVQRAKPLIGVLGGLQCSPPPGPDIRPFFAINHNHSWTIHMQMKFFDLLIKSRNGLYASNAREQLGVSRTAFREHIRWLKNEDVISTRNIWNGSKIAAIKAELYGEFRMPLAHILAQYWGLWSEPGRRSAADRASEILDRPHEFAQLINTGTAPRRDVSSKVLRARARTKIAGGRTEKAPSPLPGISPGEAQIFNQLAGSPFAIAYLLAHCQEPLQWLTPKEAAARIDDTWADGLKAGAYYASLRRARVRLATAGMLEQNDEPKTHITPKGVLEAVPIASTLIDWWLNLPKGAKFLKLLQNGIQLGDYLRLLNVLMHREDEDLLMYRKDLAPDVTESVLLRRLSEIEIINIDWRMMGDRGRIRSIRIVPDERPVIADILARHQRLKDDEEFALDATAEAVAMSRSKESLGEIAMIGRLKKSRASSRR